MQQEHEIDWPEALYRALRSLDVSQVAYVPDAGHKRLLQLADADPDIRTIALTTEEEGVALSAGAWLGGERAVVLMQSSGLGNCVNAMASITNACRFPLLLLITMRGEWREGNPWQVPMGRAVVPVLAALDTPVVTLDDPHQAFDTLMACGQQCFGAQLPAALLIPQRVVGAKVFAQ